MFKTPSLHLFHIWNIGYTKERGTINVNKKIVQQMSSPEWNNTNRFMFSDARKGVTDSICIAYVIY